MIALPGITEMVFSARSTLKVLNAETFPRSTNSVTYLKFNTRRSVKRFLHEYLTKTAGMNMDTFAFLYKLK